MLNFLKNFFKSKGIDLIAPIPLSSCDITKPHLLKDITHGTVFVFAVPYLSTASEAKRNISAYACAEDYHLFFKGLFNEILTILKKRYPSNTFLGFSDHSPINERNACAKAGLGVIGKNRLLITEKYSSFVFIGEIITDMIIECKEYEIKECISCGKCLELCPALLGKQECLSSLTQKKGELSQDEKKLIKSSPYAWGCDMCQLVCPYTEQAKNSGTLYTSIDYFNSNLTPYITSKSITEMSDEAFSKRAYSWRKKETVLRNLEIAESEDVRENSSK